MRTYGTGVPLADKELQMMHPKIYSAVMLPSSSAQHFATDLLSSDFSFILRGIKTKEAISHFLTYPLEKKLVYEIFISQLTPVPHPDVHHCCRGRSWFK